MCPYDDVMRGDDDDVMETLPFFLSFAYFLARDQNYIRVHASTRRRLLPKT
jgi:hypothetical protein